MTANRNSEPATHVRPASAAHGLRPVLVTSARPAPPATHVDRNPGMPLDLDVVRAIRVNRSAVERRAATIPARRTVKKEWQAAWLLRAVTLIDLTTLSGDDTPGNVRRLCAKARHPLRDEIAAGLGVDRTGHHDGRGVRLPRDGADGGRGAAGHGHSGGGGVDGVSRGAEPASTQRLEEIHASVAAGAREIDIVITRAHVLTGNCEALYDEVKAFRAACGDAHMKAILATGELATLTQRRRGRAMVAMMAGADFIKTSTGKEGVNATLPFALVMVRMIREYFEATGYAVGFKPAGGIRTAKQALEYHVSDEGRAGRPMAAPRSVPVRRVSACSPTSSGSWSMFLTGRYAAAYRQPMG